MKLAQQLRPLFLSGHAGVWVETQEPEEAVREVGRLAGELKAQAVEWDIARGLKELSKDHPEPNTQNPMVPLGWGGEGFVLLHNFHRFLQDSISVVQGVINAVLKGKAERRQFVVLSPTVFLPPELEKLFTVVDHPLPSVEDLRAKLSQIELEDDREPEVEDGAVEVARGLTLREAENAFALSLVQHGLVRRDVVWGCKVQSVRKKGFLELHQGEERFSDLGGMTALKDFCRRLLRRDNPLTPKGVLLLGPSGTGKSAFAKALGNEMGRPTLLMDVGRLHSKYVGESEANLKGALQLATSLSPCLLYLDEVEKSLAGVNSEGDSGVSSRLFGSLLTWMSDRTEDVFMICTANNISALPPEFSRAERFDRTFFLDLPTREERELIWGMYRKKFSIPETDLGPLSDEGWTGAEIRACCRLARSLGVSLAEAAVGLVPVSTSCSGQIRELRHWASGKVTSASTGEVYSEAEEKAKTRTRKVRRGEE